MKYVNNKDTRTITFLFFLKSEENHRFYDDFRENRNGVCCGVFGVNLKLISSVFITVFFR